MTTRNTRPVPRVIWWPRDGGPKEDLSPWVIRVSGVESLMPPGALSISLAADALRLDKIALLARRMRLQGLVSVGIDRPGGIMLGLVDSVTEHKVRSGPQLSYALAIHVSQIVGKALLRDNVLLSLLEEEAAQPFFDHVEKVIGRDHPVLASLRSSLGPTAGANDNPDDKGVALFAGKTVDEVITWAVERIPTMVFPMLAHAAGGSGKIGEYLDTSRSVTTWNDQRIYSEEPANFNGNLLGFMRTVVEPDFYEVWTSTIPNGTDLPTVTLVVRPKPFDDPAAEVAPVAEEPGIRWQDLRTLVNELPHHEIPGDLIHEMSADMSDADAFGFYCVSSAHELMGNDQQAAEGLRFPLLDTYTLTVFGSQAMEPRLQLLSPSWEEKVAGTVDYADAIPSAAREFRNRLFNWYRLNPFFQSGVAVVDGNDNYRPGDKLWFPDHWHPYSKEPGMYAYCTSVQWEWVLGGGYTCTLRYERGHNTSVIDEANKEIAKDAASYGVDSTHYASS